VSQQQGRPLRELNEAEQWRVWSRAIDYALSLPLTKKTPPTSKPLAGNAAGEASGDAPEGHHNAEFYTPEQP
jgi:hypothetical protein